MPDLALATIDDAGVATLTLNRPEQRNPTSIAMLDAMDRGLDRIAAAPDLRVVILAGAGKSFCAGLDLVEVRGTEATIRRLLTRLSEVMRRIRRIEVPTIAVVQGAAIGGGFGFMAACDFRLTHPEARIGYPPLSTGLSPALMAPWLVRIVGPAAARAMLLAGGSISGTVAHDRGIATGLHSAESLPAEAATLAHHLAEGGPHALGAMKCFLNELDGSNEDPMLDRAARVSADVIAHPETQTRLEAMFGGAPD